VAERQQDVLTLGFEPCAAFHDLPRVIQVFEQRHPQVRLISYQMTAPEQEEALRRGRIDAGFVHPPVADPALVFEQILEETFLAVLPAGHPLARRRLIPLSKLGAESFILFPRRLAPACYDIILDLCRRAGFVPRIPHLTSDLAFALTLVAGGAGVTIAPSCVREWRVAGVVYRRLNEQTPTVAAGLIRRAGHLPTALAQFMAVWRQHLAEGDGS
jgi:DNA-binding transcriptional LysR family regulator